MGSEVELEKMQKILENHAKRIGALEALIGSAPPTKTKKISLNEFILSKKPRTNAQKALCIGYFFEKFNDISPLNLNDLKNGFATAKEPIPGNINDVVNKNIQKGLMMEVEEKKENLKSWILTNSGERLVESGFEK